jgi:hypothetical protein
MLFVIYNIHSHITLSNSTSIIGFIILVNHAHSHADSDIAKSFATHNAELINVFALPYIFGDRVA